MRPTQAVFDFAHSSKKWDAVSLIVWHFIMANALPQFCVCKKQNTGQILALPSSSTHSSCPFFFKANEHLSPLCREAIFRQIFEEKTTTTNAACRLFSRARDLKNVVVVDY
jgi:hypothetical protein